jgi:hypothetical protein
MKARTELMFDAFRLTSSRPISNVVDEGFSLTESPPVGRIWQDFLQISSLLVGFSALSLNSVRPVCTVLGLLDRCGVDFKGEYYFKSPVRLEDVWKFVERSDSPNRVYC